ncbi:MAG: hypothetical protein U0793_27995 [Gemmataceae bacterium]
MRLSLLACLCLIPAASSGDKEKAAAKALTNPAKDIAVLSDRDESIPAFFRRRHIITGGIVDTEYKKLVAAKEPLDKFFVNYTSHNDDKEGEARFGDFLKIAPVAPAVAKLIEDHHKARKRDPGVSLVLERDAADAKLYRVVGCMTRQHVGFFALDKRSEGDDFSPRDLRFKAE